MDFRILCAGAMMSLLASCGGATAERPDGWYLVIDGEPVGDAIVTVKDFAAMKLDSFPSEQGMSYQIIGRVKDDMIPVWADATENAAGETIGFLYEGEILSSPQVVGRIESGHFAISIPSSDDAEVELERVYDGLLAQMDDTRLQNLNQAETPEYVGTYRGTIPAADCPGINVTLVLGADNTFKMNMVYLERDTAFDSEGSYSVEGATVTLSEKNGSVSRYFFEGDSLRMLDGDGNAITGPLADNYILKKE